MSKTRKIKIFDTTLRDGEQSAGATMTHQEKMLVAGQLAKLGVDVIEAGFPVASKDDFAAVKEIAETVEGPTIAALARSLPKDIEAASRALENAKRPRIHTFMSSSDIHLKEQFKITREKALEMTKSAVKQAKDCCDDVEFSPMDATRTEAGFLIKMVQAAVDNGAATINIPDTVGYAQPPEFGQMVGEIAERLDGTDGITISVHCHNDLGLAVANSLEAIRNGAGQVECTINGIGERAGNASLEEIVMAIHTRSTFYNAETGIKLKEIYNTSRMVSDFTGIVVQANKAVVGRNAFAHEAGIHQHGILANKATYEIMKPEMIGKETELVIGKHSGRHAINDFLLKRGYRLNEKQLDEIAGRIKELADKQKVIMNEDVLAIAGDVTSQLSQDKKKIVLDEFIVNTGNRIKPSATVKLTIEGRPVSAMGRGVGPVDAVANAIQSAVGPTFSVKEYYLKSITGGTDALADVTIRLADSGGKSYSAEAINEDIVTASVLALVKGLNIAMAEKRKGGKK